MPLTLLFDRSDRARVTVSGAQAATTLNGLVTNDVATLTPGQGMYAAILTAKGKIIADVRIFAMADHFLLDTSAEAAPGLRTVLTKYVNPRFATVTDVSPTISDVGVFGARSSDAIGATTGVAATTIATLLEYGHVTAETPFGTLTIARVPELGVEGYDVFVPAEHRAAFMHAIAGTGATVADTEAWTARRVAAGRPAWGIDMDDTTLPQEANFDVLRGVSYTKGCYVGQETVARIHFRGHVNRTLRRMHVDGATLPPRGASLVRAVVGDDAGEQGPVGELRSIARQDDGTILAIGMVRREVETGATVRATWDGGETTAHVLGDAGDRV